MTDNSSRVIELFDFYRGSENEHVVVVTHAPAMDAAIKSLRFCPPRNIFETQMLHMGTFYPYCSTVTLAKRKDAWSFVSDPVPPLTYLDISNRVDSRFVTETTVVKPPE